jgi:hypothetical protein
MEPTSSALGLIKIVALYISIGVMSAAGSVYISIEKWGRNACLRRRDAQPGIPPDDAAARTFVLASRVRCAAASQVNLVGWAASRGIERCTLKNPNTF